MIARALLIALLCVSSTASAQQWGMPDARFAAVLLVPYFEADPRIDGDGTTTRLRIIDTTATAQLVRVTLWTDLGMPTMGFDVYLDGFGEEVIDLGLLFRHGVWPRSASDGQDPLDEITPQGPYSQDINFASCTGILPLAPLDHDARAALVAAHTGQASALFSGNCAAGPSPDGHARGFVTIMRATQCDPPMPITVNAFVAGYYASQTPDSVDNTYPDPTFVGQWELGGPTAGSRVSERIIPLYNPYLQPGEEPLTLPTFFGRWVAQTSQDRVEPLPTHWRARFDGASPASTELIVFRDPPGPSAAFACGAPIAPLSQRGVTVYDTAGHATAVSGTPFPRVTQRVSLASMGVTASRGQIELDMRGPVGQGGGPASDPDHRNAHLTVLVTDDGATRSYPARVLPEVP